MRIANFSWSHKEDRFVMFVYGTEVRIISHANVGVSFFFPSMTGENCTVRIIFVSKLLDVVIQQTPGYSNRHLVELSAYSNRFSFPVDIP